MSSKQRAKALKTMPIQLEEKQTTCEERRVKVDGITFAVDETGSVTRRGWKFCGVEIPVDMSCVENPQHVIECLRKADPWIKKVLNAADEREAEGRAKWEQKKREREVELQKRRERKRKQLEAIDALTALKINIRKDGTLLSDGKVPDKRQIDLIRLAFGQLTKRIK